ncbi:MAG: hypothetical protein ACI8RD_003104 [Bacillariaceae sp.]|jgi:hypothetical protein
MNNFISVLFLFFAAAAVAHVNAFQQSASLYSTRTATTATTTTSTSSLHMTVLTYKGKKKDFKAGSPLKSAVASLGVKPKYSCKQGDCNSCTLSVGGQRIKPCIGKVPPEPRLKSLIEKGLEVK